MPILTFSYSTLELPLEQWARNGKKTNITKKEFKLFILKDMVVSTENLRALKRKNITDK